MLKRYDVLEAHLGDKAYKVGDTRTAEEADVAHLIPLGSLREAEDQGGTDSLAMIAGDTIETLRAERAAILERLKATEDERDDARVDAAATGSLMEAARVDVAAATEARAAAEARAATAEGDLASARADADAAATERDALKAEVE